MSKRRIVSLEEFTGVLFGLMTTVKEYQLSWQLNRALGFDLKRGDDVEIINKKKNKTSLFSFYRYEDDLNKWMVFTVSNKHFGEHLVPEAKQVDFFLMVKGEVSAQQSEELLQMLKSIPVIQMAVKLEYNSLKSKANLILE